MSAFTANKNAFEAYNILYYPMLGAKGMFNVSEEAFNTAVPQNEDWAYALTIQENLGGSPYRLSQRAVTALAKLHRVLSDVMGVAGTSALNALLPDPASDVMGFLPPSKHWTVMYPGFPTQVLEMDEADFRLDQARHYASTYGVELVVNPLYASRNNLYSLALVADRISNTYIIPSDIWCDRNPFSAHEMYSWYMVSDLVDNESDVRVNRKMELVRVSAQEGGNAMVGITYLLEEDAAPVRERIREAAQCREHDDDFWEIALYQGDRMVIPARVVHASNVVEINTYEQLRELDGESNHLRSDALDVIADIFHVHPDEIVDISVLKKGMTNRSFLFSVHGEKYIMRIPGEGTDQLINRAQEAEVFRTISGHGLCDDPVYINPENGYKITRYLEGVRVCDSGSAPDLKKCMEKLRAFHEMKLQVPHTFDLFGQIEFYEKLWEGRPSVYRDYRQTKNNVMSLRPFVEQAEKDWCLTHIDAVPDNFLFYTPEGSTEEALQLTDWEYSGMQDPHVDIAMFCIYSLYGKKQVDHLIDLYFQGRCAHMTRVKIYAYIAICGLLWSNWCEFKRNLGVEFGEYSLRQYRFAKDYYRHAVKAMEGEEEA